MSDTPPELMGVVDKAHFVLDGLVEKGWTPVSFSVKTDVAHASDGKIYTGDKTVLVTFACPKDEVAL